MQAWVESKPFRFAVRLLVGLGLVLAMTLQPGGGTLSRAQEQPLPASQQIEPASAPIDSRALTPAAPNPKIQASCALKVMLVVDHSYSIASPNDYTQDMRNALTAFVTT